MDKTQIEKQAKKIMDDFLAALGKETQHEEVGNEREQCMREQVQENGKEETDPLFRESMLANAPRTKEGYVQAEKKKW